MIDRRFGEIHEEVAPPDEHTSEIFVKTSPDG